MQAKDIPDKALLEMFARHQGQWAFWWNSCEFSWGHGDEQTKETPLPDSVPYKVLHAKLKSLYRRGLIGGCDCGCRGDFEITDKGLEAIGAKRTALYTGY